MATEAVKNTIRAAMSFKNTPAPNCRSRKITGLKIFKESSTHRSSLKEYVEKVKEAKKDIPEEELK